MCAPPEGGGRGRPRATLEALGFGARDRHPAPGQLVIAPPLVVVLRIGPFLELGDEAAFQEPRQRPVERPRMQRDCAAGTLLDLTHDAVAVLLAIGERQQDLGGDRRQRQECIGSEAVHRCLRVYALSV